LEAALWLANAAAALVRACSIVPSLKELSLDAVLTTYAVAGIASARSHSSSASSMSSSGPTGRSMALDTSPRPATVESDTERPSGPTLRVSAAPATVPPPLFVSNPFEVFLKRSSPIEPFMSADSALTDGAARLARAPLPSVGMSLLPLCPLEPADMSPALGSDPRTHHFIPPLVLPPPGAHRTPARSPAPYAVPFSSALALSGRSVASSAPAADMPMRRRAPTPLLSPSSIRPQIVSASTASQVLLRLSTRGLLSTVSLTRWLSACGSVPPLQSLHLNGSTDLAPEVVVRLITLVAPSLRTLDIRGTPLTSFRNCFVH
jgi:hypothetical protein